MLCCFLYIALSLNKFSLKPMLFKPNQPSKFRRFIFKRNTSFLPLYLFLCTGLGYDTFIMKQLMYYKIKKKTSTKQNIKKGAFPPCSSTYKGAYIGKSEQNEFRVISLSSNQLYPQQRIAKHLSFCFYYALPMWTPTHSCRYIGMVGIEPIQRSITPFYYPPRPCIPHSQKCFRAILFHIKR